MQPLRAVFFNQISTAHSVLFHFLMTVQPVSLNELSRVLLVTLTLIQTNRRRCDNCQYNIKHGINVYKMAPCSV